MRTIQLFGIFLLFLSQLNAQTWSPVNASTNRNLHDVCIASGQTVYAITASFYGDNQWGGDILLRSFDNGNTWDSVSLTVYAQSIAFLNDSIGTVAGGMPSCGMAPSVTKTHDKGINWDGFASPWSLPMDPGMGYSAAYFWEKEKGYVFGGNWAGLQYKTLDNGTTWTEVKRFHSVNAYPDVHFFNEINGYVMTDSVVLTYDSLGNVISTNTFGFVYKTTDGCQTWAETAFPNDSLTDIHFPNENVGYLSANFHLFKTTDAGNTWNALNLPFSAQQISFLNEIKGYAVAKDGNIYKTLDGGLSWSLDYVGDFLAIEVKKNVGFAVGKNGSIIRFMSSTALDESPALGAWYHIFPNPANQLVNIEAPHNQEFIVYLYDLNGKLLLTQSGKEKLQILTSTLAPQTYLLSITNLQGKVLQTEKISVAR